MSTALGDFVTLQLIWGCALEVSALGSKTSSPEGKVRSVYQTAVYFFIQYLKY